MYVHIWSFQQLHFGPEILRDPDPEKSQCFCNPDPGKNVIFRDRDCIFLEREEKLFDKMILIVNKMTQF